MKNERILGGARSTGIFLTKSDFGQLTEVIAKAWAKDKLLREVGVAVQGVSGIGTAPTMGTIAIQSFVRKLAQTYGLPLDHGEFYGINKHGEFLKWASVNELGQKSN